MLPFWKIEDCRLGKLFWCLWMPGMASYFMMGLTSNDAAKSTLGMYSCFIFSLVIMNRYREDECQKSETFLVSAIKAAMFLTVIMEIVFFYTSTFMAGKLEDNHVRIATGIRAGLYAREEDARYSSIEEWINTQVQEGDSSIMVNASEMNGIYISSGLRSATYFFTWTPYLKNPDGSCDWSDTYLYWNRVSGKPDLILDEDVYGADKEFTALIDREYQFAGEHLDAVLYRRKPRDE